MTETRFARRVSMRRLIASKFASLGGSVGRTLER
jgi:hypothetical protein